MGRNDITLDDTFMTRQEVADYLKVCLRTADSFIHRKDFDGVVRIGKNVRVSKDRLIRYLHKKLN